MRLFRSLKIDLSELGSPISVSPETVGANFLQEVRRLPDFRTMLDGRKWKAIPVVIVLSGSGASLSKEMIGRLVSSEFGAFVEASADFEKTFRSIVKAIRTYRQRLLAEYSDLGFLVSPQNGRYRVRRAMRSTGNLEGFLYSPSRDQRNLRDRFFTVDRDPNGIEYELNEFESLINNRDAKESDIQKFFEDNPHFLADDRITQALPHVRLENQEGQLLIPDFVIKPIVACQRDSTWEVLDLKMPGARLLAGSRHVRLSHEVTQAIAQLRDYGDYFRNSQNTQRVTAALGHSLRHPRLAVLIGRLGECNVEELEKAQSRESDVRIVTYDEILERQQRLAV